MNATQTTLGPTGLVVNLDNGHDGWCVEVAHGLTYCGETFDRQRARVGIFAVNRPEDHPHCTFCFDCTNANSFALRDADRSRMEGSA